MSTTPSASQPAGIGASSTASTVQGQAAVVNVKSKDPGWKYCICPDENKRNSLELVSRSRPRKKKKLLPIYRDDELQSAESSSESEDDDMHLPLADAFNWSKISRTKSDNYFSTNWDLEDQL